MSFRGDYCDLSTHLWGVKHVVKERMGRARKVIKPRHTASVLTFTFYASLSSYPAHFLPLSSESHIMCLSKWINASAKRLDENK